MLSDSLELRLSHAKNVSDSFSILPKLANSLKRFDSVKSKKYAVLLLEISIKYNNGQMMGEAFDILAVLEEEKSNFLTALELQNKALSIRIAAQDSLGIARSFNQLGVLFRDLGKLDSAMYFYTRSLSISERLGFNEVNIKTLNNIGFIFFLSGKPSEALPYYQKALDLAILVKSVEQQMNCYTFMASHFINIGQFDKSIEYNKIAILLAEKANDYNVIAVSNNNIGAAFFYKNELITAIDFYLKSYDAGFKSGSKHNMGMGLMNAGEAYMVLGNHDKAFTSFKQTETIAKAIGSKNLLKDNYFFLYQLFNKQNDLKNALIYFQLSTQYKDSLTNEKVQNKLFDIERAYQTEKKEQQIKIKDLTIAEQDAELEKNRIQVASSVGGIVILVVVLGLLYNAKRLRERVFVLETAQKLQSERERISSDLHDHVGAQLTSIISGLQMTETVGGSNQSPQFKQLVESLKEDAQVTITHLRDTIWTLKEEEITPSEFAEHIEKFAESALRYREKPVFHISNSASEDLKLNPATALNLTRVVEESIHNSIKHAEADDLWITLNSDKNQFIIEIKDNGKGFNLSSDPGNEHYGLNNMKRRVGDVGGVIQFESKIDEGLSVLIHV